MRLSVDVVIGEQALVGSSMFGQVQPDDDDMHTKGLVLAHLASSIVQGGGGVLAVSTEIRRLAQRPPWR